MENWLVPMYALGAVIVLAIGVTLFRRFVPVKREIGDDFFGSEQPRATTPTQPDPEEVEAAQPTVPTPPPFARPDPYSTATVGHPNLKPTMLDAALAKVEPEKTEASAPDKCCACGQPADPGLIELEDWQQVNRLVGAVLAFLGYRARATPGRRLYVNRSWCRSCAAIADFLNARFERDEGARAAATRRVWERKGLVDAVKDHIADADGRYDEDKRRRERASRPWRGGE